MQSKPIEQAIYSEFSSPLSLKYNRIEENVKTLNAVTGSGKILSTERNLQEGMGLNIKNLFIGSRGVIGVLGHLNIKAERLPRRLIKIQGTLSSS